MMKNFFVFLFALQTSGAVLTVGEANKIVDAIFIAEGGNKTKYPYGIISVKTSNPRQICLNTINNNYRRWQTAGRTNCYISYLGGRYCPISDPKDIKGLNKNWIGNVRRVLGKDFVKKINSKKD